MSRFSIVVKCDRGVINSVKTESVLILKDWCEFFDYCDNIISYAIYDSDGDYYLTQTNSYEWCRELSKLKYGEV